MSRGCSDPDGGAFSHPARRVLDGWFLALCVLAAGQLTLLASSLLYPDLSLQYPFLGGDGADWIANGLFYLGADVRISGRPPLVPLLLAGLERLSLMPWYPILGLIAFHGAALAVYTLVAPLHGRWVAAAVAVAMLLNVSAQHNALLVMADVPAVCLLMLATLAFVAAEDRRRLYPVAGLLAAASALTQQTALLLPIPAAVVLATTRRRELRTPGPWLAALLFASPLVAWFVVKRFLMGSWGDVSTRQWSLLAPHLDSVGFYASSTLSMLGWPGTLLALVGVILTVRRWRRTAVDTRSFFTLALLGVILAFFVLFYQWQAKRFLLYALFLAGLPIAESLAALPRRGAVAASVALVVWSAWPLERPELGNRWTLWPVPTIQAIRSGPGAEEAWRVERIPAKRVVEQSTIVRVRTARARWEAGPMEPLPDPVLFARYESAVLLDDSTLPQTRYTATVPLGNALRKRVKLVAATLYPADWWGWVDVEELAAFSRYRVLGVHLEPLGGDYLVAVDRESPLGRELLERSRAPAPLPPRVELIRGARLAREISEQTSWPEGLLVVFPEHRATTWYQLLPFVSRTSNLFMLEQADVEPTRAMLEPEQVLGTIQLDGLELQRTTANGLPALIVP